MAYRFVESIESRDLGYDQGKQFGSRWFRVFNDTTGGGSTLSTPEQVTALYGSTDGYGTTLPAYGHQYPSVPGLVALSPRTRREPGHNDLWIVEWAYRQLDWTPLDKQPNEVGYVARNASGRGEPRDLWQSLSYADIASLVSSSGHYPYGTPDATPGAVVSSMQPAIDVAGVPTTVPWKVVDVTLAETVNTYPSMGYLAQFLNRRNNVEVFGAQKGMVLYTSWDVSEIDMKLWRVTHHFSIDQICHLLQAPDRTNDGSVLLAAPSTISHATNVRMVQPFPDFADFRAISVNIAGALA